MKIFVLIMLAFLTACGLDPFTIHNNSLYPTSYGRAIVASVKANAAPDIDLRSWEMYMHKDEASVAERCPKGVAGCTRPYLEEFNVLFDPNFETPPDYPLVEGWLVDIVCHEMGHIYLTQTTGDSGMRYDEEGIAYHETEGVWGEWFRWPREKCLPVINEFGGFGNEENSN